MLALTGFGVWVAYLFVDRQILAWTAVCILGLIALLGLALFARWIPVYRAPVPVPTVAQIPLVPPESAFPLALVFGHGLFAASTVVLVLLTALGVGGS